MDELRRQLAALEAQRSQLDAAHTAQVLPLALEMNKLRARLDGLLGHVPTNSEGNAERGASLSQEKLATFLAMLASATEAMDTIHAHEYHEYIQGAKEMDKLLDPVLSEADEFREYPAAVEALHAFHEHFQEWRARNELYASHFGNGDQQAERLATLMATFPSPGSSAHAATITVR